MMAYLPHTLLLLKVTLVKTIERAKLVRVQASTPKYKKFDMAFREARGLETNPSP